MTTANRQIVHVHPLMYSGLKVRLQSVDVPRVAQFFNDVDEQTIDDKDCSTVEWRCNGELISPVIGYMYTEIIVKEVLAFCSVHSMKFPDKY